MSKTEPESGVVRRIFPQTPRLTSVILEVSASVAAQYTVPGQVLACHTKAADSKPVYLALASSPGEARAFEVLLGEGAVAQLDMTEGATWKFDGPFGKGYPVDAAKGKDVLLFAVGSALAPLRPVIETIRRQRDAYGAVTLFVGAHTEADFPFEDDIKSWAADGITVRRALSKPWVQDIFRTDPPALDNAFAFVCGMPAMMDGVIAALTEAGLPADNIGKNW